MELSLPVFTTEVSRGWGSNTTFRLRGQRSNPLRRTFLKVEILAFSQVLVLCNKQKY